MDNNEFSFDALLRNDEFSRSESLATHYAKSDFLEAVREYVSDEKAVEKLSRECEDVAYCVFEDAFKQGFCFAVKSARFFMNVR